MEATDTRTISLLMTDVKSRKFIGVRRKGMEKGLESLNMAVNILARRNNAMWDFLMALEEVAKVLAGSVLATKAVILQTKYVGTLKIQITFHRVAMYVSEDHLGDFMGRYGHIAEVLVSEE